MFKLCPLQERKGSAGEAAYNRDSPVGQRAKFTSQSTDGTIASLIGGLIMMIGIGSFLILALLSSAQPGANRCSTGEEAAAEIRASHEADRRAHLEGKVELMEAGMADQLIMVSNGNIMVSPKEKTIAFFKGYFERVKYLEWSDAEPPKVNVSPDGQMGWMAVKVRARYVDRTKPEAGEKAFRSSWIATYQRVACKWKMTGNASAVVSE